MTHLLRILRSCPILVFATCANGLAQELPPTRCYLIGNSLTWDTVPPLLSGDVQWHVDCGVHPPVSNSFARLAPSW